VDVHTLIPGHGDLWTGPVSDAAREAARG